jgi:hypothetical protein
MLLRSVFVIEALPLRTEFVIAAFIESYVAPPMKLPLKASGMTHL